ncbi:hypothetical protein CPIN18021_0259 [Campylobacter pinnipediorum subsp. caledonicus]|uniref:Uncharacterized protein n=1 Tax=Campylobacter pinnipediorum subsp. caledonicus TaxID=1874362 RepID=A0A1S6U5T8_9BACT|nr:hypothetical protein [Campylobacter pinnipediorum]AQW87106.1 hypothetical protein CPIN18021_0259 [Campylobacter pinnipediorum subsp. caledonicus]
MDKDLSAFDVSLDDVGQEPSTDNSEQGTKKVETKAADKPAEKTEPKAKEPKTITMNEDEYHNFKHMEQERELDEIDKTMKNKYSDFNVRKIIDKILEFDKKDPGFADLYYNPMGFENIYLTHFKDKQVEDDEFDTGRGMAGGISMDERIEKMNRGEASYDDKLGFYSKFFA